MRLTGDPNRDVLPARVERVIAPNEVGTGGRASRRSDCWLAGQWLSPPPLTPPHPYRLG
jgi:hypothetical protein